MPFFALYNKYSGILRVFVLNPQYNNRAQINSGINYAMWRLQQWNWNCGQDAVKSKRSALLSVAATDPNYMHLDDYNSDMQPNECNPVQQVNFSIATQRWIYTDFILSGYDPNNRKTVFQVTTSPFAKGNISADLTARLTGEGTLVGEADGTDGVKTIGDAFKSVGDLFAKETSDNKKADKITFMKALSGVGTFLGSVSSVGNLFKYLVGIFDDSNNTQSVKRFNFSGDISGKITGSLEQRGQEVSKIYLGLTNDLPYDNTPGLYKPVQNIPWGVFSLEKLYLENFPIQCYSQNIGYGQYRKYVWFKFPDTGFSYKKGKGSS